MVRSLHDIPGNHNIPGNFPAIAGGSSGDAVVFVAPFKCTLQKVQVIPEAAITGSATNNPILTLFNRGVAGTGTAELQSVAYAAGTNLAALTPSDFYAPATPPTLEAGTVLELVKTENGSGMAIPQMQVLAIIQGA